MESVLKGVGAALSAESKISVLLVDDHALVADLLSGALSSSHGFEVDVCSSFAAALAQIKKREEKYDVILLDYELPDLQGMAAIQKMVSLSAGNVVVFTSNANPFVVEAALKLGVYGYISKSVSVKAIGHAVRLVADGEVFLPSDYIRYGKNIAEERFNFRQREIRVLSLLAEGLPNKEIGAILKIEEWAVKSDVKSLARKLEAKNRTQVILQAKRLGIL